MKQLQVLLRERKARGYQIAKTSKVIEKDGVWFVPSASNPHQVYQVVLTLEGAKCTCEDYKERSVYGLKCKHYFAVQYVLTKTINRDGTTTITQTKRTTYPQDWSNYTKAQTEEGRLFKELLKDLVENVPERIREGAGRPRVPLSEGLFCAIDKVYSMQSSRRAYSRYKEAESKMQITKAPNYNVINILLNRQDMTPILTNLLHITALPLKSTETKFSVDSTGFRTTLFSEYCKDKHNTKRQHQWVKCHALTGNTTNIVASAIITTEHANDSPQFIPLLQDTANQGFSMLEVSADKAYNSKDNYNAVSEIGGTAYIPFKSNTSPWGNSSSQGSRAKIWRRMYHYFQLNQEEFLTHYHNRSNVETTFMSIKFKFGDCLKSRNFVAQMNELLCKLIAYNITVLISAMYELKIEPNLLS